MTKNKTLSLIAFLGVFTLLGYQNCSKVGVEDASGSAKLTGDTVGGGDPGNISDGNPAGGGTAADPNDPSNPPGTTVGGTPGNTDNGTPGTTVGGNPGSPGSPGNAGSPGSPGGSIQPGAPPAETPNTTTIQDPGGEPQDLDPASDNGRKINCKKLLASEGGLDLKAVNDDNIDSVSGVTIVPPVRNLTISSVSGLLIVQSALDVSFINSGSGQLIMRALKVGNIGSMSGGLCVSADSVGSMESSSGNDHIKAKTIETISVHSGNLHIYGATVNHVADNSGNICLHDGAKILNFDKKTNSGTMDKNCK